MVKDPATHQTLWRADFDAALLADALAVFRDYDEPVLSFTDRMPDDFDFIVARDPTGRPFFDDYLAQNRGHGEVVSGWPDAPHTDGHFHLCAIGSRNGMLAFEQEVVGRLGARVRTFVQKSPRYVGTMCEVLHRDASKWSAILHLAALWGIEASEICAVGDDMNDVPMIAGAGLGVAMGHAPPAVLAAADHVTADHDADGVARFVEDVLLA